MSDKTIEQEIQTKGKTAPRITPADLQANIKGCVYFTAQDGVVGSDPHLAQYTDKSLDLLTFCVLVLRNGFTVTGESACASPENFDAEIGRKIARQNAEQKMWPLMGYELKQRQYASGGKMMTQGCINVLSDGTRLLESGERVIPRGV
ncbi:Gp49 family protein [Pseudomonas syringae]|nr:Gp49 family protein [Pseudomonas syringae]EPN26629.1 putative gene 66 protein [Pseudomonas syringae pv. actinidiae ICMP 19096]EPM43227.1 putative gene 66 protein [Pseudomonas syringae pv. actinidiae ICMP 19098]EPM64874.1 putative gene 66 protein [Pseudomonas syringae pv. actinidiae ICMP 18804]EPN21310.1 putative gene 66 protein [Pseudomonas syringae pv. actinidiae ICMP 19100]EPN24151.1 putative gene 66 protein [Pseudomonas syringae pv. actinidiae ICMP 19099]